MSELTKLGIAALRDGVRAGDFSAREVAEAHIARVAAAGAPGAAGRAKFGASRK